MPSKRRSSVRKKENTVNEFIRLTQKYHENLVKAPESQGAKSVMSLDQSFTDSLSASMAFQAEEDLDNSMKHHRRRSVSLFDESLTSIDESAESAVGGHRRRSTTNNIKKWTKFPFSFGGGERKEEKKSRRRSSIASRGRRRTSISQYVAES